MTMTMMMKKKREEDDEEEKEQHDDHEEEDSDGDEDKDNLENCPSEHGTSKVPRINDEKQKSRTISSKIVSHLLFADLLHIYLVDFTHLSPRVLAGCGPERGEVSPV